MSAKEAEKLVEEADYEVIVWQYADYKGEFCPGYSLLTKEEKMAREADWKETEKWLEKKAFLEEICSEEEK